MLKAKANHDYAVSQAERYQRVDRTGSVTQDELEGIIRNRDARQAERDAAAADLSHRRAILTTRSATIGTREAAAAGQAANVRRLRELQGFKRVVAPFDGVVTRRQAEVGNLVTPGSGTGARPLFGFAQTDRLRAQVQVPQGAGAGVVVGDAGRVTLTESTGRPIPAKVARTAGAVESSSRTLLVELELPNADGRLLPGAYAQVTLPVRASASLLVPTNALLMRSDGPHVVAVGQGETLSVRRVALGRDLGAKVEIAAGLEGDERLVVNPSDELRDGQRVEVNGAPDLNVAAR